MSDLRLSTSNVPSPEDSTQKATPTVPEGGKKRFGLGCALIGCLTLFLMVVLPIIGGVIYVGTLDEEGYGALAGRALHWDWVKQKVMDEIKKQQPGLTDDQLKLHEKVYDRFVEEYDKLPDDKRSQVNKLVGTYMHKKVVKKEDVSQAEVQKMAEDILKIMNIDFASLMTDTPPSTPPSTTTSPATPPTTTPPGTTTAPSATPPTTTAPSTTTAPNTPPADPYSFDLPPSTPTTAPKDTTQPSQYDF